MTELNKFHQTWKYVQHCMVEIKINFFSYNFIMGLQNIIIIIVNTEYDFPT